MEVKAFLRSFLFVLAVCLFGMPQMVLSLTDAQCEDVLRHFDGVEARWLGIDPMADKYPDVSPYVYCEDNPLMYVDPDGEDVYMFGEDGVYVGKLRETGSHYGQVVNDKGEKLFEFIFADPVNDPASIDKGYIYQIYFIDDQQIEDWLQKSGVNDKCRDKIFEKYRYITAESNQDGSRNQGTYEESGKMDYALTSNFNGIQIFLYKESLFIINVGDKTVAHNAFNLGNFLWGAGGTRLGITSFMLHLGAHVNNLLTMEGLHLDSKDDQMSIKLGIKWAKSHKK